MTRTSSWPFMARPLDEPPANLQQSQASSAAGSGVVKRHIEKTGRSPGTLNLKRSQPVDDAWARKSGVR